MNALYNSIDTIAAIATPIGIGGISVIRISGNRSFEIVELLLHEDVKLRDLPSHTIHYKKIFEANSDKIIDSALVSLFRNPHSYTGDDVIEISSHGGYYVSKKILEELFHAGARPAQPGEFTLRAFLNGKLDLSQAEAVADIIHSKSEKSHKASVEQLEGRLSQYVNELRSELLNLCSLLELELDFSQEGIELAKKEESIKRVEQIESKIYSMIKSYATGKLAREGVKVALAGRPNVGKSSLLNLLLGEERAIVSEIPGTTRDTIEESIMLDGLEFVFTDTAGLRDSIDIIEKEGIRRTIQNLQKADVVLFLVDSSVPLSNEDVEMYNEISSLLKEDVHSLFVINKIDFRHNSFSIQKLSQRDHVEISCKTYQGISELKKMLVKKAIPHHDSQATSVVVTNIRHKEALMKTLQSLQAARESLVSDLSSDFVAVDLRDALNYLGEIIGITTPDDILNNIFSKFCIGK